MKEKTMKEYEFNYKELLKILGIKGKLEKMEVIENEPHAWNCWLKITIS